MSHPETPSRQAIPSRGHRWTLAGLTHRLEHFHHVLSYLSAAGMFMMMLPTVADVCGRLLFNTPLRGAFEFTGLVMAFVIYLGIPYAQTDRTHVRVSFLVDRMSLTTQRSVEVLVQFFSFAVTALVLYATTTQAVYSVRVGEYMYGSTRFPMWPSRVLVAFGLLFLGLQFLVDFLRAVARLRHERRGP
ncbi:MAG: TRAP transporter small permease subunit [Thermodesulfobacteriota bacterium]